MVKELEAIDASVFRSLAEIRQDQQVLDGLLQKAHDQKEGVSAPVFDRVVKDYQSRLDALETRAKPLRVTARAELAKLYTVRDQLKAALDVAVMDHEELKFRLQVGELSQEDFEPREKTLAEVLAGAQQNYDEVERVCKQFAEVVPAEPAGTPAPAPEPAPVSSAEPEAEAAGAPAAPPPPPPVEDPDQGTVVAHVADLVEGTARFQQTMAAALARLVEHTDGGAPKIYELGAVANIGRVADNHVAIDRPEVSRNHARITMKEDGSWVMADLGSGNGTYVNGKRIKEQQLESGDKIRIGKTDFTFEAR
jgi:hypothetical protein